MNMLRSHQYAPFSGNSFLNFAMKMLRRGLIFSGSILVAVCLLRFTVLAAGEFPVDAAQTQAVIEINHLPNFATAQAFIQASPSAGLRVYVNSSEADYQSIEFSGNRLVAQGFSKIEEAIKAVPVGGTIYLCSGQHAFSGTLTKSMTFLPSQDPTFCEKVNGNALGRSTIAPLPAMQGFTGCEPGNRDCNICVKETETAFRNLNLSRAAFAFDLNGHPTPQFDISEMDFHGHWQGVQRFDESKSSYLIASRDIIQDANGALWSGFAIIQNGKVIKTIRVDKINTHVGGIQVMGNILAMGDPVVNFIDISSPAKSNKDFTYYSLPTRGFSEATAVAMAKLKNGRYLVAVAAGGTKYIDFYVSDPGVSWPFAVDSKNLVQFSILDRWYPGELNSGIWNDFQGINLVTDCKDGALYLIATGNIHTSWTPHFDGKYLPIGKDTAVLYKLSVNGNQIKLAQIGKPLEFGMERPAYSNDFLGEIAQLGMKLVWASMRSLMNEDGGNFDAGAGVFVNSKGQLLLYTTQHGAIESGGKYYTNFTEFRDPNSIGLTNQKPKVSALGGLKGAILVVDNIGKISKTGFTLVVHWAGNKGDKYVLKPVAKAGGWIWDKLTCIFYYCWDSQNEPIIVQDDEAEFLLPRAPLTSTLGVTYYYTVTVMDEYGNESLPSDVITATLGRVDISIPDINTPPGGQVSVPLQLANGGGLVVCAAQLPILYDSNVLSPTLVTPGSLTPAVPWYMDVITPGILVATAYTPTVMPVQAYGSGSILEIAFDVLGGEGVLPARLRLIRQAPGWQTANCLGWIWRWIE